MPLKRSSNNQWPYYNTNGPWQSSFPMPIRITSASGETIEDSIPNAKGGDGSKQFGGVSLACNQPLSGCLDFDHNPIDGSPQFHCLGSIHKREEVYSQECPDYRQGTIPVCCVEHRSAALPSYERRGPRSLCWH